MIYLRDRDWKEFSIDTWFDVRGTITTKPSDLIKHGRTPRVTCAATNNALDDFYLNAPTERGGVLTIDSATIGFVSFHPYDFIATDHVEKLVLKNGKKLNYWTGLFVKKAIEKAIDNKFGYGYKFAQQRIKRQTILLPATADGTPDWLFMEQYMKQTEQQILKPTLEKLCKQLITNELMGGGGKTIHPNWKEFVLGEEFDIESTSSSIDKNKLQEGEQNFPYITRTDNNNGIDHFVPEQNYALDEGNVITIGLDTQTVFYQPAAFYTGQNIQVIRHKQLNKYNALFIRVALQWVLSRFSWGSYGATLTRLRKSRIYLPATNDGKPDFDFMAAFMQQVEKDILQTTLPILQSRLKFYNSCWGGVKLDKQNWKDFCFTDIFTEIQRGKRLKRADHKNGNMPYISSRAQDNGVDGFIGNECGIRLFGDCLTLANSGSVGSAFYHQYEFVASDHVTRLKNDNLDKYIYLFMIPLINRLSEKYSFNREINDERIKRERLFLPVTADGTPDWQFMESYMRNLESQQIAQYLAAKLPTKYT